MIRVTRCSLAIVHWSLPYKGNFERKVGEVSSVAQRLLNPLPSAAEKQPSELSTRAAEVRQLLKEESSVIRQRLKEGEGSGCVAYMPEPGDPEFDKWLEEFEQTGERVARAAKGGQGDFFVGCGSSRHD